jgi:cystathionine beta-lyase
MTQLPVSPLDVLRQRGSAKWRMYPPDVTPFTVAEMDFDLAEPVADALRSAIGRSDLGYADGFDDLADAYAGFARSTWGWQPNPGWMTAVTDVGVGVVELLRALGTRRVVLSSPVYPPFFDWVGESNAELVDVPLVEGRLDLDRLGSAFEGGGVYLLCNPQNPTGTVHAADELQALVGLAAAQGVTILSDEIHAPLALPGATVTPILSLPGAEEVAFALASASKTWNLAGLKCALVIAGSEAQEAILGRLPPDTRWRVGSLGVVASAAAFRFGEPWRARLIETLDDRRRHLVRAVGESLPELDLVPPAATFLAWLSSEHVASGTALVDATLRHGHVALEPGERFGAGGARHVRLNYATSAELLDVAVTGLRAGIDAVTTDS